MYLTNFTWCSLNNGFPFVGEIRRTGEEGGRQRQVNNAWAVMKRYAICQLVRWSGNVLQAYYQNTTVCILSRSKDFESNLF